jgi:rod shape-determining protein MreC
MRDFFLKNKKLLSLLAVLILSFILVSYDISRTTDISDLKFTDRLLFWIISPFQIAVTSIKSTVKYAWVNYVYLVKLKEKNEVMADRVQRLEMELAALKEKASTADRLVKFLEFKEDNPHERMAARVIGVDSGGYFKTVILDKGEKDGLALNMPVVTAEGVVGRIIKLHFLSSQVLLMVDYNSAIDALVQRTRDRGIVVGLGESVCEMKYVSRQADVKIGDVVVTSGLAGIFPKGLVIGRVSGVEVKGYSLFQRVTLETAVQLNKLEEVFILGKGKV